MSKSIHFLFFALPMVASAQITFPGGLTPQQIQQRAAQMGYSVDTAQIKQVEQAQLEATPGKSATAQAESLSVPSYPFSKQYYFVPAFRGRSGADTLNAFGYNVFTYSPTTFQPAMNVPTPTDYIIGPGDEVIISLWGETQLVQDIVVSKNGDIYIPNVGLVEVNGLTMNQLRDRLYDRLSKVYSSLRTNAKGSTSTHMNVSTGQLRSVKVYVIGEVAKPGGYTFPALSSAFTALYYSGGPNINGSLRNVEVVRGGKIISSIDMYNYLVKGDQSEDVRLNDGDIVFVPPVGKRAAMTGSVFRPAIYEMKKGENLGDLLRFAAGLTFDSYFQRVHIERIIPFDERRQYRNNLLSMDVNFDSVGGLMESRFELDDGDVVTIPSINNVPENRVSVGGDVRQPGVYELLGHGMRVSDLLMKADSVFPDAFLNKALLIRTLSNEKKVMLSMNLGKAMQGDPDNNIELVNRDSLYIFRDTAFFPTRKVEIFGNVKKPGKYDRYQDMTLTDLIIIAGGLDDSATTENVEVTRLDTLSSNVYASRFTVNMPNDYWNVNDSSDFKLQDYDRVLVKPDTAREYEKVVDITGEVVFPGSYTILHRGEKLSEFVRRAGGYRNSAYTDGIYVLRSNPLLTSLRPMRISDTAMVRIYQGQPLIDRTQFNAEFGNRIPISWSDIRKDSLSIYNLELKPGDTLVVPRDPGTVSVVGDVGLPSTVPYKAGAGLGYYVKQAGGYTTTSAQGDEVVILPNGKKWEQSGFFLIPDPEILSGSTIYIPSYIKQPSSDIWPLIRDVITVVSSTAVLIFTVSKL
ncbi:MAG TPA: SLBB domain-containing protein [Candidatus Acidoferrales bacterium]|nr:SLBB domain-containing protein [Candidatus Acidoferrales bacterium]